MATALVCALAVAWGAAESPAESAGHLFESAFSPEKAHLVLGEPAFFVFELTNRSSATLYMKEGGDYRNRLGRPENFEVWAEDASGMRMPGPDPGETFGGRETALTLEPGATYRRELFAPNWAELSESGTYTFHCRRTVELAEAKDGPWQAVTVSATATVHVGPPDDEELGGIIAAYGKDAVHHDPSRAERAVRALSSMDDERAVPYLVQAAFSDRVPIQLKALRALGRYQSPLALLGLAQGARDDNEAVRVATAHALGNSAHPQAGKLLGELSTDPAEPVRLAVVTALEGFASPTATKTLAALAHDDSERVREAARAALGAANPAPSHDDG